MAEEMTEEKRIKKLEKNMYLIKSLLRYIVMQLDLEYFDSLPEDVEKIMKGD